MAITKSVAPEAAQSIIDSLVSSIAILDVDGKIMLVNRAWAEFGKFNGKGKCCIGENYLETCRKSAVKDALSAHEGILDVINNRLESYHLEYPCQGPQGTLWFQLSCTPFGGGDFRGVMIAHHDVTALKDANEKASAEEAKMRAIYRAVADAVIICNAQGEILSANLATERLLRTMQSALIGRRITSIICTELTKLGDKLEAEVKRGDETRFNGELSVSICKTVSEPLLIIVIRDVSQRVQMQQSMSAIYSNVCHELRSPLASIIGGLSLIGDGIIDPSSDDAMEMITSATSSADRLVNLITTYLDRDSIIRMDTHLDLVSSDASELLRKVRAELAGLASEANIRIRFHSFEPTWVCCDIERIHQVLVNLLSNAIKYSPAGADVVLSAARLDGVVRFSVEDRGPGIPLEAQERIFEPFAAKSLKLSASLRGPCSVGLGLSISQAIVEAHGGTIGIQSIEGTGSLFWFELPQENSTDASHRNLSMTFSGPRRANGVL